MAVLETPEYTEAVASFTERWIHALMSASDPVFGSLSHKRWPEGVKGALVEVAGAAVSSPIVHMRELVEISRDDAVFGNLERFHDVLAQIAESHLKQFMPPFYEYVGEAAEAVGNAIELDGKTLTWDDLLDAYQQVEWAADVGGMVRPPRMVAGTTAAETIRNLGEMTPAQQRRASGISEQKQDAHVSRRRSRRLR